MKRYGGAMVANFSSRVPTAFKLDWMIQKLNLVESLKRKLNKAQKSEPFYFLSPLRPACSRSASLRWEISPRP